MTIFLEHTTQMDFFTDMSKIIEPFKTTFQKLKWLVTDLEFISHSKNQNSVSLLDSNNLFIEFTGQELSEIINETRIQFILGVFSGFKDTIPTIANNKFPYADGNQSLWINPEEFQISSAEIEIVCWDSSLTILKFKDPILVSEFISVFPEAKEIKEFLSPQSLPRAGKSAGGDSAVI